MASSISFITAFKSFVGLYDIIQRATIYSWQLNGIKTIVPSNEADTKIKCAGYPGISIIDGVKRGRELGFSNQSPVLKDLIEKALPAIDTTMVGFINSDVMIEGGFAQRCEQIFQKYGFDIFMVGSRSNIRMNYYVDNPDSFKRALTEPRRPDSDRSDVFITSKFMWRKILKEMPEFILGRYCWDDWLVTFADVQGFKRYNCTQILPTLHCEHPKTMILKQEGLPGREAPSSKHNMSLWHPFRIVHGSRKISDWETL
jgi:hypothetical protein